MLSHVSRLTKISKPENASTVDVLSGPAKSEGVKTTLLERIAKIVTDRFEGVETKWTDAAKIGKDTINQLRWRTKSFRPEIAKKLCDAANCRRDWLLYGDGEPYALASTMPSPGNNEAIDRMAAELAEIRRRLDLAEEAKGATPAPPAVSDVHRKRRK
jgi:hypothetical protein